MLRDSGSKDLANFKQRVQDIVEEKFKGKFDELSELISVLSIHSKKK